MLRRMWNPSVCVRPYVGQQVMSFCKNFETRTAANKLTSNYFPTLRNHVELIELSQLILYAKLSLLTMLKNLKYLLSRKAEFVGRRNA